MDSARAVNELDRRFWLGETITSDEGEKSNGLASTSGHLEEAVALRIQGSLKLQHIRVLLWVYVVVWKVHSDIF